MNVVEKDRVGLPGCNGVVEGAVEDSRAGTAAVDEDEIGVKLLEQGKGDAVPCDVTGTGANWIVYDPIGEVGDAAGFSDDEGVAWSEGCQPATKVDVGVLEVCEVGEVRCQVDIVDAYQGKDCNERCEA